MVLPESWVLGALRHRLSSVQLICRPSHALLRWLVLPVEFPTTESII